MLQDYDAILQRLLATKAVQESMEGVWIWEEKPLKGWDDLKTALERAKEGLDLGEATLAQNEGALASAQTALHAKTKQVTGLAKVRFRKDAVKSKVFEGLRALGTTVATTRKSADDLAAAWTKADASGSYVGTTLADYNAMRTALSDAQAARESGRAGVKAARKNLDAVAKDIYGDLVAWYAAAGRVFPENTVEGQLLRTEIRTG